MQKITPAILFSQYNAKEAIDFYLSIFKDAKIIDTSYYPENGLGPAGEVLAIEFELFGQRFIAINGGPECEFTEAVSFMVNCDTQEEIDRYWDALVQGGKPQQCGWLKDRYGLVWQITPPVLYEMITDKNAAKAGAVMQAMIRMVKIEIEPLKEAYRKAA
jgi:predicted 3-demethylubiquinone-9 3-methyltransferase (glyoxalase superfamily)